MIFGGGKIARGFIGHLLYLQKVPFVFIDVNPLLIEQLNSRKSYRIRVMGNSGADCTVQDVKGILMSDVTAVAAEWASSDLAFTAAGGKNLIDLGEVLAKAFTIRCDKFPINHPFDIITCENWTSPAKVLGDAIKSNLSGRALALFEKWVGISEAVVMRSAVEPDEEMARQDPLGVCVQDYWELPVDRDRLKGEPFHIDGVRYIDGFQGFLERKFYTYNSANGTVSYLGYLRHHQLISAAAHDEQIVSLLDGVYQETGEALVRKYGLRDSDQTTFALSSRAKLRDRNIVDYVERNARDPIRKLGPTDRLIGPARLAMEYGVWPAHLATAIAAAMYYDHPNDPAAQELCRLREEGGINAVLTSVCKLSPEEPLSKLVTEKVEWLAQEGWLHR